jgi:hypothetical protein
MMRTESNHARGTFQQLRIALLGGLTCKLLSLYHQIDTIKSDLEVCTSVSTSNTPSLIVAQLEVDKQRLDTESGAHALVPGPADGRACVMTRTWMFTDHRSLRYCYPHEQCRRSDPSVGGHCALSVRHN